MKNRWLSILKTRCSPIDWTRSRICSKHFEHTCFDSKKRLKESAVPTMFPAGLYNQPARSAKVLESAVPQKTKLDLMLNKVTQSELLDDVRSAAKAMSVPGNFIDYVTDDLQCNESASIDVQLWLLIKKQEHLITRMTQSALQNKKHVEVLQKNIEQVRKEKKDMEQSLESHKYIAKCLQEKHATLEEQIEILTAVESR